jgi:hypothetical protein
MPSVAISNNGTAKGVNNLKPYYSEFVRHCLRYYIKTIDEGKGGHPVFKSEADKANWRACYIILNGFSEKDVDTIFQIYRQGDTVADNIYQLSKERQVPQATFWNLTDGVERKIAKKRGLI